MPVLIKERETKKIYLPSTRQLKGDDRAWVKIKDSLLVDDIMNAGVKTFGFDIETSLKILKGVLTDWNYTDKDDKKLPINEENLRYIKTMDIYYIMSQIETDMPTKIPVEDKKK